MNNRLLLVVHCWPSRKSYCKAQNGGLVGRLWRLSGNSKMLVLALPALCFILDFSFRKTFFSAVVETYYSLKFCLLKRLQSEITLTASEVS